MRICKKCKVKKPLELFYKSGCDKNGIIIYKYTCKNCINTNWTYRLMSSISSRTSIKKKYLPDGRLKKTHSKDKITINFLDSLRLKQNDKCYWLNINIDFTLKDKLRKPSIDRLDNSKGYTLDNIVLTTVFANTGRRDATISEMKEFINNFIKINNDI